MSKKPLKVFLSNSAEVNHLSGIANVEHENVSREILVSIVQSAGYTVDGKSSEFNWRDGSVWRTVRTQYQVVLDWL